MNIFSSLFPGPSGHTLLLVLGQAFQIHHEVTQQDKSSLRLTGFRLLDDLGPDVVCCFANPLCQTSLQADAQFQVQVTLQCTGFTPV